MKKLGFVFPGQGSQFLGMGKELYDKHRIIQDCFEQASKCLDNNFVRLCFAASERELRETINAQTSIFLVAASVCLLLQEKYGIVPDIVAGHSSGEYAAMFAAGGMSFPDALYLVNKRALFMEEATRHIQGGMTAVIGIPYDQLKEICARYDDPSGNKTVVEVVNYNSPKQLVISGTLDALQLVENDVRDAGGKAIKLNVAGAFHSRLMNDAAEKFALYMVKVDFKDLRVPMVSNVDAQIKTTHEEVKEALKRQMSGQVMWWPSMQHLKNCDIIVEVGPGQAYAKMLKREWPQKEIISIGSEADVALLLKLCGKVVEHNPHNHEKNCNSLECAEDDIIVKEPEERIPGDVL